MRRRKDRQKDFTTTDGAAALIERIKAHWADKPFAAPKLETKAPRHGDGHHVARVDIRSDMVNGLPRQRLGSEAP